MKKDDDGDIKIESIVLMLSSLQAKKEPFAEAWKRKCWPHQRWK